MLRIVLIVFILAAIFQFFTQWWTIAPVAIVVCYLLGKSPSQSFLGSFLAVFLLWGGFAFWRDSANGGILAERIAEMLGAAGISSILFLISALIGALVAGLAGYTGYWLKQLIQPANPPSNHYEH